MVWSLAIIAALGIANFALHAALHSNLQQARRESGPAPAQEVPGMPASLSRHLTLIAEFAVLLAALLLAARGWPELAWAYLAYSALNAMAAWLVLRQRR
jgi:hypothetical protein